MTDKKFNPKKLDKLNRPERLKDIPPDYVLSKLDLEKADVLVEIGAGTAFFSIAFLKYAQALKIYACDISEVMIDYMKEIVVPKYPDILPVHSGEDSVPLDDGVADLVFMINLHHELENPIQTVTESSRILKPGGTLFIVDWKREDMQEGPPTKIRCTTEQVKEQLETSGFENVDFFNELPKHFLVVGKKEH